jgi:hypothetical protein
VRVYVPATISMLRSLVSDGKLAAISGTAFAVTPKLRESYASGDDEELSYAAMADAVMASLRLVSADLDADSGASTRRVVVCADVDGARLRPDLDDGAVTLPGPVPMDAVAAVYVDLAESGEAVRAAAAVVDEADLGDPDAEFTVGEAEDHELAWYAPQEVSFLLELL